MNTLYEKFDSDTLALLSSALYHYIAKETAAGVDDNAFAFAAGRSSYAKRVAASMVQYNCIDQRLTARREGHEIDPEDEECKLADLTDAEYGLIGRIIGTDKAAYYSGITDNCPWASEVILTEQDRQNFAFLYAKGQVWIHGIEDGQPGLTADDLFAAGLIERPIGLTAHGALTYSLTWEARK